VSNGLQTPDLEKLAMEIQPVNKITQARQKENNEQDCA